MKTEIRILTIVFLLSFLNPYNLISNEKFIYYQGGKHYMQVVNNFIAVKFGDNTPGYEMNKTLGTISPLTQRRDDFTAASTGKNKYSVSVIELKPGAVESQFAIESITQTLKSSANVNSIGACYKYNDKVLHFSLGEVIVKFKKGVSKFDIDNLNRLFKTTILEKIEGFENTYLVLIDRNGTDDVFDLSNKYAVTQFVEFAHPNFLRTEMLLEVENNDHQKHKEKTSKTHQQNLTRSFIPNDTLNTKMWNLNNTGNNIPLGVTGTPGCDMKMFEAWNITSGNPNVMIAIVDTGIDTNHTDLRPNLCNRDFWYDAYDNDQKPYDEYYHGTGVSGIPSAVGNNIAGNAGIAYSCQIMPVRVFGPYPAGFTTDLILAKGLNWSWQHGACVINCSWGGGIPGSLITFAVQNAVNYGRSGKGTVVFGGSGNADTNLVLYPASMPEVIGVGGLSPCFERKSKFSCDNIGGVQNWGACYGEGMELVAPCTFIGTTELGGGWCVCGNGTSDSSPMAAGVAGLMLSKNINLSGDSVKLIMEKYAWKVGNYNYNIPKENGMWNEEMGYGMIDAKLCLDMTPAGPTQIYDQVPPMLTIYPPESNVYTSPISVDAVITDNIGLNVSPYGPRLYYKSLQSNQLQMILGSKVGESRFRFTFPVIPYSEGVYYYIAAQDVVEVPNFVTYPLGGAGVNPPGNVAPQKFMFVRNTNKFDSSFASADVPIRIAADRETSFVSILNNPVNKTILDVNVLLNVQHTFDADLSFSLISPSGTEIILAGGVGVDGDNFTDTYFDDEAPVAIDSSAAAPPFTGVFRPVEKLWLFDGENSLGEWKLRVTDNGFQDGGFLLGWSVIFKYSIEGNNVNMPGNFSLVKNYPNPFNPRTRILFNVPRTANIKITVYDAAGREVSTILNEQRTAALEDYVDFDASNFATGVYFYSMQADGEFIESKKMVLVK
ncbi:MAG TPA: S8 family serine peptidase [Ignavibacteria bacterium]|nr:S8 family serine peptidase [Ignavibacteria bacterium]